MKKILSLLCFLALFLSACTGAETITKKRWENKQTTLRVQDLTKGSNSEAGRQLGLAVADAMTDSIFIVTDQEASYSLKFKVTDYQEGNRLKRFATFGIDEGSRARLKAKVALYNEEGMLGAWEVDSWVNGGPTGGSEDDLFEEAAEQILRHLKGY